VLAKFREDGANGSGAFADTTGYMAKGAEEAGHWEPILSFGKPQLPTTPQWPRVMPFALTRADQFRPPPPPQPGTEAWRRQITTEIDVAGALTDSDKAAAEFWNEWGSSPSHHLIELTTFVSDHHGLRIDADVKLFFVVSNTLLDASIAAWDAKYAYDYVRPITAIRSLGDVAFKVWRPRSLPAVLAYSSPATTATLAATAVPAGIAEVRAAEWESYLPTLASSNLASPGARRNDGVAKPCAIPQRIRAPPLFRVERHSDHRFLYKLYLLLGYQNQDFGGFLLRRPMCDARLAQVIIRLAVPEVNPQVAFTSDTASF